METAGEERERGRQSLLQIEEIARELMEVVNANDVRSVHLDIPTSASAVLNELTTITSREDAEKLLAAGISMWNSAINLDCHDGASSEVGAKIRHVAADCIYMSITVLGGISIHYDIDEISLLKFYTVCGRKYAELDYMQLAFVCFEKANEFVKSAEAVASDTKGGRRVLAKALFDLLIGRAECAWEKNEPETAEKLVSDASLYLQELPDEYEFLASVQYNFGLFAYQSKDNERALGWLRMSIATRGSSANKSYNASKQGQTFRLMGVSALAQNNLELAQEMMRDAESTYHDPVGMYFLLKLAILRQVKDLGNDLGSILDDDDAGIDICMAAVALFCDSQRLQEATDGFARLFARFSRDMDVIVRIIGPRYFQTLTSIREYERATEIFSHCFQMIESLNEQTASVDEIDTRDTKTKMHANRDLEQNDYDMWFAIVLRSSSALADQQDFCGAAYLINYGIEILDRNSSDGNASLVGRSKCSARGKHDIIREKSPRIFKDNEGCIRRLAASCAISAAATNDSACDTKPSPLSNSNTPQMCKQKLLLQAMKHAQRAKIIDPLDFATRLLLFRLHLLLGDSAKARIEIEHASQEIKNFDAGALAEAACEAKENGTIDCVLAVLRCILRCRSCAQNLGDKGNTYKRGLYGTVLVSAVNIAADEQVKTALSTDDLDDKEVSPELNVNDGDSILLSILRDGLAGLHDMGLEISFDDKLQAEPALAYLADVSWNAGRRAGEKCEHSQWAQFFDICYDLNLLRKRTISILHTCRIARLQTATAILEAKDPLVDSDVGNGKYTEATKRIQDIRKLTQDIRETESRAALDGHDPIIPLVLILETRCLVGLDNQAGISKLIDEIRILGLHEPGLLEQVAALTINSTRLSKESSDDNGLMRLENASQALSLAIDMRLQAEELDMPACSIALRELIDVELSRTVGINRAYLALERALAVLIEHEGYPQDEQRWLTATAWDTSQMLYRTGQPEDAHIWAQAAIRATHKNSALLTYVPRIEAFISHLTGSDLKPTI